MVLLRVFREYILLSCSSLRITVLVTSTGNLRNLRKFHKFASSVERRIPVIFINKNILFFWFKLLRLIK